MTGPSTTPSIQRPDLTTPLPCGSASQKPPEGTYNFREVSGFRARTGTVRRGKLFRSDALNNLTEHGRTQLDRLGIGFVIDLRTLEEVRENHTPSLGAAVVHAPIFPSGRPTVIPQMPVTLTEVYDEMIDHHARALARAVWLIGASGATPTLVHCTAGKDRTGLVVALALLAVGVNREDVIGDYAQTERNLAGEWRDRMLAGIRQAGMQLTPELVALIAASPAEVMERIIGRLDSEWGSAADYLSGNGLTDDDLDALVHTLAPSDPQARGDSRTAPADKDRTPLPHQERES